MQRAVLASHAVRGQHAADFQMTMNNSELDRTLKAAKAPERPEEYWKQFPQRVTARLHWKRTAESVEAPRWFPRLAWGLATAAACLLAGFLLGHWRGQTEAASNGLLQNGKVIREMLTMFPNRVRAIVQDERGLSLVLSEKDDVPVSPPLWVKVCDGKRCSAFVAFSGQEVEIAGLKVTVLSDARGGVMLVGDRFVWSSGEPERAANHLRIEARQLAYAKAG